MENEGNKVSLFFDKPTVSTRQNTLMSAEDTLGGKLVDADYNIALIGVSDNEEAGGASVADAIRKSLYALKGNFKKLKIADLGNIKTGGQENNSLFGLQCVVEQLTAQGVVCIVLGNNQRLTTAMVEGLSKNKEGLSLSVIDSRLDLGCDLNKPQKINEHNFLLPLTIHPAVDFCNVLAFQQYYCSEAQLDFMEQNNALDTQLRLGALRYKLFQAEPTLRDTDVLSIDMNAIRQADAPAATHPSPNGLMGEEACQLMRFAGTSDRISVIGLFGMETKFDSREQTSALAAQLVWHLLEGLDRRVGDYPASDISNCQKNIIPGEREMELHFYFSSKLNRWWVEVPTKKGKRIMACQPNDYENAKQGQTPAIWFRNFLK